MQATFTIHVSYNCIYTKPLKYLNEIEGNAIHAMYITHNMYQITLIFIPMNKTIERPVMHINCQRLFSQDCFLQESCTLYR